MRTSDTIIEKKSFKCDICYHIWYRKYDYENHLKTKKHAKIKQKIENFRKNIKNNTKLSAKNDEDIRLMNFLDDISSTKKVETQYCCEYCQFSTTVKKESEKHKKSKQHIRNENKEEDFLEIINKYICVKCDKKFNNYKTCWGHSKLCKGKLTEINSVERSDCSEQNIHLEMVEEVPAEMEIKKPTISNADLETLKREIYKEVCDSVFGKILENNQIMMEKMTETMTQTQSLIQSNNHNQTFIQNNNTNNNTTNNTTNNHCTMNVFLNEKCKDAMNMFDFISNLNITFDHLYHQADNGFQKGLTNIMLDNLKLLSVYNRPIHFTDLKREIMYIKDNDEWTKHEDKEKLIEALEWAAKQGINSFVDWREATSAENESLESPTGQMWMKLMQTVVQPYNDRMKAYPKIMKDIARNVHLRKEDQI